MAPKVSQSGDRSPTGALSKAGSRTLRWAAVAAAPHAWRPTNPWHQLYTDVAKRAGKNPAKSAVARKILIATWHAPEPRARTVPLLRRRGARGTVNTTVPGAHSGHIGARGHSGGAPQRGREGKKRGWSASPAGAPHAPGLGCPRVAPARTSPLDMWVCGLSGGPEVRSSDKGAPAAPGATVVATPFLSPPSQGAGALGQRAAPVELARLVDARAEAGV